MRDIEKQRELDRLQAIAEKIGKAVNSINTHGHQTKTNNDKLVKVLERLTKQVKGLRKDVRRIDRPILPASQPTWVVPDWNRKRDKDEE